VALKSGASTGTIEEGSQNLINFKTTGSTQIYWMTMHFQLLTILKGNEKKKDHRSLKIKRR